MTKKLGFHVWDIPLGLLLTPWPGKVRRLAEMTRLYADNTVDDRSECIHHKLLFVSREMLRSLTLLSHLPPHNSCALPNIQHHCPDITHSCSKRPHTNLDTLENGRTRCSKEIRTEPIDLGRGYHQTRSRCCNSLHTNSNRAQNESLEEEEDWCYGHLSYRINASNNGSV
jgi:hypothetical protein